MDTELRNAVISFAHRLANNNSPDRDYVLSVGGSIEGDESCEEFGVSYMPWCSCEMCQLIRLTLVEDGVDISAYPQPASDDGEMDELDMWDDDELDDDDEDDFWEED